MFILLRQGWEDWRWVSPCSLSVRHMLGALFAVTVLSGCAAPPTYMGIDISGPATATSQQEVSAADYTAMPLSTLASKAQGSDKHAQLELGIRFEEGWGVAADQKKARKLYVKAAADSGGRIWVYSPPVGNGTSGRVIPVDTGPKQSGLVEAKRRLGEVE